jgi:hypothetical protein
LLDHDAAADGFDGTVENRNEPVAGGLNQPAVMFDDAGFDELALDALDTVVRAFLTLCRESGPWLGLFQKL